MVVKTPEIHLTSNALTVLTRRYLKKDEQGRVVESPEEMFRRVANNVAQADLMYDGHADIRKTEEEFYRILSILEFLPNSPTLMNAGRPLQQLAACFVLPIEDSLESIFDGVKNTALIHQSGGGTGFSFSRLRPKDDPVPRAARQRLHVHASLQYGHRGDHGVRGAARIWASCEWTIRTSRFISQKVDNKGSNQHLAVTGFHACC
jgi:ribonucleotide reductase alpha subunit